MAHCRGGDSGLKASARRYIDDQAYESGPAHMGSLVIGGGDWRQGDEYNTAMELDRTGLHGDIL